MKSPRFGCGIDIVGDVHGNFDALIRLLAAMGYEKRQGGWRAPEGRELIFAGDLIDRGPGVIEVLRTVRDLEQAGVALAVMGNHEYNFLAINERFDGNFAPALPPPSCGWVRSRTENHLHQHIDTFASLDPHPEEKQSHLRWMMDLPLLIEFDRLRVVHAAWLPEKAERLRELGWNRTEGGARLTGIDRRFLHNSFGSWRDPNPSEEFQLIELLIKGPEVPLPGDLFYTDKLGIRRKRARVRWWLSPEELSARSWEGRVILPAGIDLPFVSAPEDLRLFAGMGYPESDPPVVVGHYWQTGSEDAFWSPKTVCVDWSTARGGPLAAYRWSGELALRTDHFISVPG